MLSPLLESSNPLGLSVTPFVSNALDRIGLEELTLIRVLEIALKKILPSL